jgi:hypothetical protein
MKKLLWSGAALGIGLVVVVLSLGIYLYNRDVSALRNFDAAYRVYDSAIAAAKHDKTKASKDRAAQALSVLKEKSRVRVSSVLKNDALLNNQTQWIAGLAGQEFAEFRTGAKSLTDWASRRRAAFAQFRSYIQ